VSELASEAVRIGTVVPVEVDGHDFVIWRGDGGTLGSAPSWCPHLDWDLGEGRVVGDELVCAGHGWSFDCAGHAFKRTELGRVDPKDDIETLRVEEADGVITATR